MFERRGKIRGFFLPSPATNKQTFELAKVFDKDHLYAIGLVIVPFVLLPLLAFGSARYIYAEESGLMEHLIDYQ